MTELTTELKAELKQKLIDNARKISADIENLTEELKDTKENFSDAIDQASAVERGNAIFSQSNQKKASLQMHKNALKTFDEDFGYCVACGTDIEIKRLVNNPAVKKCFDCQTLEEHKNKHAG